MANIDSTLVSNRALTPRVANSPWNNAKIKTSGAGVITVSTAETANAVFRFFRVRSNAVIKEVLLSCDAIATAGAVNIGLYDIADNGGTAVSASLFASAQVVTTALMNSNVAHESGTFPIASKNKPIWEALGLASDPGKEYDLAAVVTTAMGGAGGIVIEATYVDGGA